MCRPPALWLKTLVRASIGPADGAARRDGYERDPLSPPARAQHLKPPATRRSRAAPGSRIRAASAPVSSDAHAPRALAIAAHPDDIEFMMAGTLILLRRAGWQIHYLNLASGDLGSMTLPPREIARVRRREAQAAARRLGAVWHPPLCPDLQIFYDDRTLRRLCAIIRAVEPAIILAHSPQDYMEDHMAAARLAVSAAFARGVPGYRSSPSRRAIPGAVTLYHASPHGLRDGLRRRVHPGAFADTTEVHAAKRAALACHASQQQWLDATQGMNSYLQTMDEFSRTIGRLSGTFEHAEGWRRHSHLGFCEEGADPLRDALGGKYLVSARYERSLERGE
jgi:LmbE family N-acetylglucosaminyl deacetylase